MFNSKHLCKKITTIYLEIGTCGIDIDVARDIKEDTRAVHLKKESHSLKHFLELNDANRCMDGQQCVSLGVEIAQLMKNSEGEQF